MLSPRRLLHPHPQGSGSREVTRPPWPPPSSALSPRLTWPVGTRDLAGRSDLLTRSPLDPWTPCSSQTPSLSAGPSVTVLGSQTSRVTPWLTPAIRASATLRKANAHHGELGCCKGKNYASSAAPSAPTALLRTLLVTKPVAVPYQAILELLAEAAGRPTISSDAACLEAASPHRLR